MKKNVLYGLAIGIACWTGAALTSCSTFGPEESGTGDGPFISLTFGMAATDADGNPALTLVEQQMQTVDLFFYPANGTDGGPVKTHHIENTAHDTKHTISLSDEEFQALFRVEKTADGTCVVYAVVNVPEKDFAASGISDKNAATPADLKKIKATTPSFAAEFKGGLAMFSSKGAGDVISYDATSKKATGTIHLKNLAAKIDLLVNFEPDVEGVDPNGSSQVSQKWNVEKNSGIPTAEVHILNGVQAVVLGGFDKSSLDAEKDYYSIRYNDDYTRGVKALDDADPAFGYNGKTWYATSAPYYSYPNVWEDSPLEQHRTSLLLKVDWLPEDAADPSEDDVLTTYYNVPLALDANELESNKYYRVKVNINTLGGQNFGEPLTLEGSWEVLDWTETSLEADLRELRYLEVNQTQTDQDGTVYTAVVNGAEGIVTIPFDSSHEVAVRDVTVEYMTFDGADQEGSSVSMKYNNAGTFKKTPLTASVFERQSLNQLLTNDWQGAYIDNVNKNITVKYPIGGPGESSSNYYPLTDGKYLYISYKITITLRHTDTDQDFENDVITIIRHPSIYVEGEVNPGFNFTWNQTSSSRDDASQDREGGTWLGVLDPVRLYGFVRINNESYKNAQFGGLTGIVKQNFTLSPGNWFDNSSDLPIMYVVTATKLENTDDMAGYHIKDPRVTTNEAENLGASWTNAPHYLDGAFDAESVGLRWYYPTNGSTAEEDMYAISPKFRIASAFGIVTREMELDQAKRRCASYSEYGYPAGRWRLPTVGELKFVQMLSNRKLIPRLFNTNTDYVTAQGVYRFDGNGNDSPNGTNGYVRCVYDDWYWLNRNDGTPDNIDDPYGARSDHKIFIWGDREKNSPQVQEIN